MDIEKRNKLKQQIKRVASLTDYQAGKITGAVIKILGEQILDDTEIIATNRTPKDCDIAMHCTKPYPKACIDCTDFIATSNPKESFGPLLSESPLKKNIIIDDLLDVDWEKHSDITPVILSPKEFALIENIFMGALHSHINDLLNKMAKHSADIPKLRKEIESVQILIDLKQRLLNINHQNAKRIIKSTTS